MTDIELRAGDSVALVSTLGGACRSWTVDGRPVVDAGHGDPLAQYRGTVLAPWPNRTVPSSWQVAEAGGQLVPTPGFGAAAIHGLVGQQDWEVAERGLDRALLVAPIEPSDGYPFRVDVGVGYEVRPRSLTATFSLHNRSSRRCPAGIGWHPYLAGSPGDLKLDFAWSSVLGPDDAGVPRIPVEFPPTPLRPGRYVLDHSFELVGGPVDLVDGTRRLRLHLDPRWRWLHVFTADSLPGVDRRASVAVEPMTCPSNALHTGRDLLWVQPGETVRLSVELELVLPG